MEIRESYNLLHRQIAKDYQTTESVIAYVRGVAGEKFLRRQQLLDLVIEKLKIPKLGKERLQKYQDRLRFLGKINDEEFESILSIKLKDQNGAELTTPNVATR